MNACTGTSKNIFGNTLLVKSYGQPRPPSYGFWLGHWKCSRIFKLLLLSICINFGLSFPSNGHPGQNLVMLYTWPKWLLFSVALFFFSLIDFSVLALPCLARENTDHPSVYTELKENPGLELPKAPGEGHSCLQWPEFEFRFFLLPI